MAKYILTFGTDRFTGSRGGSTFQKSGVTFVIRKRAVPVQKKTPEQSQSQNTFSSVQQNWRKLNNTEKDSFADEAPNYPRTDSLGNQYFINGQQLQASANLNLLSAGQEQITTMPPPTVFPAFSISAIGIDFADQSFVLQINLNPIPAGFALKIFASAPLSVPTPEPNTNYKLIASLSPGTNQTGANYWAQYVSAFGLSPNHVNTWLSGRGILVDTATGVESAAAFAIGDIAP